MNKRNKLLSIAGLALVSTITLAACGNNNKKDAKNSGSSSSSQAKNTKSAYVFSTDPNTLDYTFSSKATNGDHFYNFVEGLMAFDQYGNLQPALAEDWEISKDGLTYTYHLRKGVNWVDNEGNKKYEVKAQDFVTGLKHAVEAKSETLYIVANSIKGLADYVDGKNSDFSSVGVKAVDDYTVQYTLNQPETYWNSKTTYGILYPISEEYLKEKGKDFGQAAPDGILYNGPYVLTNFTSKSVIEYAKNEEYWDKDNVKIDDVKFTFSDGSDPDSYYRGFDEGTFTEARLFPNNPSFKDVEKKYKDNIVWSLPDRSTYNITFNYSRKAYNATSKKSDAEKQSTQKAVLNKEFRQAIQFALDKKTYQAQSVGEEGALKAVRNTFVPGDFVTIKGKPFAEYTQKYLQEMDPAAFKDVNLADSQDAYFNKEKAKEFMAKAKAALQKENVQFPIHLDLPQNETNEILVNTAKSFKKTIEDTLGKENVVIDIQLLNQDAYYAATYQAATGAESDFDISNASGWSADYTDPQSYLNVYQSQNGDLLHTLGLEASGNYKDGVDPSKAAKDALKLNEYDDLLKAANAITDDLDKRYEAYAKAEAWLLDNVIQIPVKAGGGVPSLTKGVPFTKPYGMAGSSTASYKGKEMSDKTITSAEYDKLYKEWLAKREETAKKASEEVAKKMAEAK